AVYYLLEDMRIPTKCICGVCGIDSTAIIVARNEFRDKQVALATPSANQATVATSDTSMATACSRAPAMVDHHTLTTVSTDDDDDDRSVDGQGRESEVGDL